MHEAAILILTNEWDFQSDFVIQKFNDRGIRFFRYDTAYFPLQSTITAEVSDQPWQRLDFAKRAIDLASIKSVWYRRPTEFEFSGELDDDQRRYARVDALYGVGGILRSLDAVWFNHPEKMVSAEFKPYQLTLAKKVGMSIPKTLLTNDPEEALRFYESCNGRVVFKSLANIRGVTHGDNTVAFNYTSLLSSEDIEQFHLVKNTICLFQEYVDKAYELRINVVSDSIFATEIYSQNSDSTRIDWRRKYSDLTFGTHELPADMNCQLRHFMQLMGLSFGAIDMIVTPNGDYVFLEINPDGQWAWVEQLTGLEISEAVFDMLTRPLNGGQ